MHVDQAGRDDLAAGVKDQVLTIGRHVIAGDAALGDQEVRDPIQLLTRIDDAAPLDQDARHERSSGLRNANMIE